MRSSLERLHHRRKSFTMTYTGSLPFQRNRGRHLSSRLNAMAPIKRPGPSLRIRQFDEDGPTHMELLGFCVGGLCVLMLAIFICWKIVKCVRARRYWQATSPTVRYEATGASPSQPTFPFHDKEEPSASHSGEASVKTTEVAVPSPVYDALKAGRPPSYRTSILMWRETTARETAAESLADRH